MLKHDRPSVNVCASDKLRRRGSELVLDRLRRGGVEFVHGDVRSAQDLADAGHWEEHKSAWEPSDFLSKEAGK
jgi:CDP-paratose 2-epimerase